MGGWGGGRGGGCTDLARCLHGAVSCVVIVCVGLFVCVVGASVCVCVHVCVCVAGGGGCSICVCVCVCDRQQRQGMMHEGGHPLTAVAGRGEGDGRDLFITPNLRPYTLDLPPLHPRPSNPTP